MARHYPKPIPELSEKDKARFWRQVDKHGPDECWPWLGTRVQGYGIFHIKAKPFKAHRIGYFLTYGIDPGASYGLHKCDNRPCCNPVHLFLGTLLDNSRDRDAKGRTASGDRHGSVTHPELCPRGEDHGRAILTEKQVTEIKQLIPLTGTGRGIRGSITAREIAERFGVDRMTIVAIKSGRNWHHLNS